VLAIGREDAALTELIVSGYPAIRAEIVYAVRHEMAVTIEDVLARRIGLQLYSWRDAIDAAPVVAGLMAAELHWDADYESQAEAQYIEKIHFFLDSAGLSRERQRRPARVLATAD
jgi:glycerol-3-phosphate dehydrogenase